MATRDDLHRLIDELSDTQLDDASSLLDALRAQDAATTTLARGRDPETERWQRSVIEEAVAYADDPHAEWVSHQDVVAWLRSWGTEHERSPTDI